MPARRRSPYTFIMPRGPIGPMERAQQMRLPDVARITTLSPSTIKRRYPHLIRHPSPNTSTMSVGDVLDICEGRV